MQRHFSLLRGTALVAAFLGTGGLLGAAELPKSPEVAETGKLAIANTLEYAPFEFIDENGKQVGINIELAEEAAKLLGAELEVTRIPFPSMIPGLAAGRFKVAWETFAATDDRLKQVDFVMFIKSGIVASTIANYAGKQRADGVEPASPYDFMPYLDRQQDQAVAEEQQLTDDELAVWADAAIFGILPE